MGGKLERRVEEFIRTDPCEDNSCLPLSAPLKYTLSVHLDFQDTLYTLFPKRTVL